MRLRDLQGLARTAIGLRHAFGDELGFAFDLPLAAADDESFHLRLRFGEVLLRRVDRLPLMGGARLDRGVPVGREFGPDRLEGVRRDLI